MANRYCDECEIELGTCNYGAPDKPLCRMCSEHGDEGDPALVCLQYEGRRYYCTVCHQSEVAALDGYDTCDECLSRR